MDRFSPSWKISHQGVESEVVGVREIDVIAQPEWVFCID
jgi:hypothetical protein